jgi:hypothetical protein
MLVEQRTLIALSSIFVSKIASCNLHVNLHEILVIIKTRTVASVCHFLLCSDPESIFQSINKICMQIVTARILISPEVRQKVAIVNEIPDSRKALCVLSGACGTHFMRFRLRFEYFVN